MVEGEEKIQLQLSEIQLKKTKVETEKALNPLTWGKIEGCREDRCGGISAA